MDTFYSLVEAFIVGVVSAYFVFLIQYWGTPAHRHVTNIQCATRDIIQEMKRIYTNNNNDNNWRNREIAGLRNRYRYSMGVPISVLYDWTQKNQATSHTQVPPLIIGCEDRWKWYDDLIRNIFADLLTQNFMTWLRFIPLAGRPFQRLKALIDLCESLERIVGELDKAIEQDLIEFECVSGHLVSITARSDAQRYHIESANLQKKWNNWLSVCSI